MRRLKAAIPGRVPARECVVLELGNLLGHQHHRHCPQRPSWAQGFGEGTPSGVETETPPPHSFQAPSLGPMLLKGRVENNLHPQVYVA